MGINSTILECAGNQYYAEECCQRRRGSDRSNLPGIEEVLFTLKEF